MFVSCFVFYCSTLVRLVSRCRRHKNKQWRGFSTERRMSPKPFSGDVTGGADISGKFVPFYSSGKNKRALWDEYY